LHILRFSTIALDMEIFLNQGFVPYNPAFPIFKTPQDLLFCRPLDKAPRKLSAFPPPPQPPTFSPETISDRSRTPSNHPFFPPHPSFLSYEPCFLSSNLMRIFGAESLYLSLSFPTPSNRLTGAFPGEPQTERGMRVNNFLPLFLAPLSSLLKTSGTIRLESVRFYRRSPSL